MKNFVQEIARKFGIKKEFADGRQVYNFMKDYQRSIEKNKLSARAIALAGEGVAVTEVKKSMSPAQRVEITDNVNALGQTYEVEGGNRIWQDFGADEAIKQIKDNGYLDALIHAQYKADVVPVNFVSDVITELTRHIKNYKPEMQLQYDADERTGLFGWINPQIGKRATRVYNENYKGNPIETVPIEAKTAEGAPVVQIAAEKEIRVKKFEEEDISPQARAKKRKKIKQVKRSKAVRAHGIKNQDIETMKDDVASTLSDPALPSIDEFEWTQAYRDKIIPKLFKKIQAAVGTGNNFAQTLKDIRSVMFGKEGLPTSDLVKMEKNENEKIFAEF